MQQHKEEAQAAAIHRGTKDAVKRAFVHATHQNDQVVLDSCRCRTRLQNSSKPGMK